MISERTNRDPLIKFRAAYRFKAQIFEGAQKHGKSESILAREANNRNCTEEN